MSMRKWFAQRPKFFAPLVALATAFTTTAAHAHDYVIREVMSGLVSPRGLAFGPDGGLYVAEAGSGGDVNSPSIILGSGNRAYYGTTGGLSRLLNGVQERVLDNLPSLSATNPRGLEASGLSDIVFDGSGTAFGVMGLGANPALRADLGAPGADFSTLVRLPLDGSPLERIADLGTHEIASNPDGGLRDSNPFGMALAPDGRFLVADAGANDFLSVTAAGDVSTLGVLPNRPNPLPFGPPSFQSVPTSIAVGPDDAYYIGQLTGFPFPPGAANVYRFDPATDELTVAYGGFTNISDLTFDENGDLYVLQLTTNGLASATPGPGALIKIDSRTGERATIASEGLLFPGSVEAGPDGVLYVTNQITSAAGQVLSLTLLPPGIVNNPGLDGRIPPGLENGLPRGARHAVPEPTSAALSLLGCSICCFWRRQQRRMAARPSRK